jgi:hypothetical protein
MSLVAISGNASGTGTLTIAAPNTNSDFTLTLPQNTGTLISTASTFGSTGPAFVAYGDADQVISTGTYTKVAYNVETYDTNNNYDTTNYRFLPTVAGYYLINAYTEWQNTASTALRSLNLYRNGSLFRRSQQQSFATSGNTAASFTGIIYFNGTTDYVEMYVIQSTGSNLSILNGNGSTYNWFEGYLARSA